jgi:hypothetical protein
MTSVIVQASGDGLAQLAGEAGRARRVAQPGRPVHRDDARRLMMNATAWQDFRRIWRAATTWRDPLSIAWIGRVALVIALAAGMARLAGVLERGRFWHMEVFVLVGWFGIVWMMYFLPASVLMNSAPNARLVPRQRRRLRQMAGAGWLFMTFGATLAFGTWAGFPLFAAYMLGTMLLRAGFRPAVALVMLAGTWPLSSAYLPPALLHAIVGTQGLAIESTLLVLAAIWSLALLYPAGGDRHMDGREQVVATLRSFDTRNKGNRPGPSWISRFAYVPALQRDCWLGKPEALLMHVLGPGAHWSAWLPGLGIFLAIVLAAVLLLNGILGGAAQPPAFMEIMGICFSTMTVIAVFSTAQFPQLLGKTRGEQALLRLTPLAGNAALLNRRLSAGILKAALISWVMASSMLLLLVWVASGEGMFLLRELGLCCLGGQLAMSNLLGDFARGLPSFTPRRAAVLALEAGCSLALAYGLAWVGGEFWTWLALVAVAGAVFLLVRSRRAMLAAPPAFPVERIEDSAYEVK